MCSCIDGITMASNALLMVTANVIGKISVHCRLYQHSNVVCSRAIIHIASHFISNHPVRVGLFLCNWIFSTNMQSFLLSLVLLFILFPLFSLPQQNSIKIFHLFSIVPLFCYYTYLKKKKREWRKIMVAWEIILRMLLIRKSMFRWDN